MKTFAELLGLYVRQAGITDSELARAIHVSRQTVFRWREGLISRPNNREDVLAISRKLRLSSEERDTLLLSAGFRPEYVAQEYYDTDKEPGKARQMVTPDSGHKDFHAPEVIDSQNGSVDRFRPWTYISRRLLFLVVFTVISIIALVLIILVALRF